MNILVVMLVLLGVQFLPIIGKVRVVVLPSIFKVFPDSVDGFTFGKFIFVRDKITPKLLAHEKVHVEQYKKLGVISFLTSYYFQMGINYIKYKDIDKAYHNISFEIEAYTVSDFYKD